MLKKILTLMLLAAITVPVSSCSAKEIESYEDLFVKDGVIDIHINIDEADLEDMYTYATNEEYHTADITVNGVEVENVGIRTKGNMTLRSVAGSDSDRYSYRIKFNKYVKKQKLLGLDELCLNNCYSDASYMREYLHYEILEELGMNTPKTSYCNLYINGKLSGFYLAVEGLEDTFLEREFGSDYESGNLYKMEEGSTLEYKEDENYSYAELKSGKDKELTGFKSFIKKLNDTETGTKGDIESFLDVDSALKYIATNTVLCNYDSYSGNMHHNFYLYQTPEGVFTVVPWDFNMSFGGFGGSTNVGIDTPYISGSLESLPLIGKLLSVEEYKSKYYGYIQETMEILADFEDRVNELKEIIKPHIEKDPTAFYTVEQFENATTLNEQTQMPAQKPQEKQDGENQKAQEGRGRSGFGGGMFGSNMSIINCVNDRLENLKAQFDGTAERTTNSETGRGGFGGGRRPGGMERPEGMTPSEGMTPPEGIMTPPEGIMTPPEGIQRPEGMQMPAMPQGARPQNMGGGFGGGNRQNDNAKIRLHIDGHIISFDTDPVIENDTTLVGFRAVLEELGAEVVWDEKSRTVTAKKDGIEIVLAIDSDKAYVNGKEHTLDTAPKIIENSTMIPVRFISEQLGMKVSWDGTTKLVTVTSK